MARATTTISILRGDSAADAYGDIEPSDTPVYTGIPASIMERTKHVFTADAPTPMIVRYSTGRVGNSTDLRVGDRIKDESSGVLYAVDGFGKPSSPVHAQDIRIELRIIT
jgi:hypothetical protein